MRLVACGHWKPVVRWQLILRVFSWKTHMTSMMADHALSYCIAPNKNAGSIDF